MSVIVIPDTAVYDESSRAGSVSVFAETKAELEENSVLETARLALVAAGMPNPGLNDKRTPYPVDAEYKCDAGIHLGESAVAGFRMDLRYMARL